MHLKPNTLIILIGILAYCTPISKAQSNFSLHVDRMEMCFGINCYAVEIYVNSIFDQTNFFYIEDDTIRWRGYQYPGEQQVLLDYVYMPTQFTVGDQWYGWLSGPALFLVENYAIYEVPYGTYWGYYCDIADSATHISRGCMISAVNIGGIAFQDGSTPMVLETANIVGGTGIFPLVVGNTWNFTESGIPPGVIQNKTPTQEGFKLLTAFPNPFNPTTTINFDLPMLSQVNLSVYDIHGKKVAELANGMNIAGAHTITFDGTGLPSGIYIYRLTAGEFTGTGKMVLLK